MTQTTLDEWVGPEGEAEGSRPLDACRICLILCLVILGAREIIPLV